MNILQVSKGIALAAVFAVCLTAAPNAHALTSQYIFHEDGTTTEYVMNDDNAIVEIWEYDKDGNIVSGEIGNPNPFEGAAEEKNPAPYDPDGNPLDPNGFEIEIDPAATDISQIEGGQSMVQGHTGRDALINPAPDDSGGDDKGGVKPGSQNANGSMLGGIGMELDQIMGVQEDLDINFSFVGLDYVQLHNPADSQSQSDQDGGEDNHSAGGTDGTNTLLKKGLPSLPDLAFQAVTNPPSSDGLRVRGDAGPNLGGALLDCFRPDC